jgi:hypothetical protein
VWAKVDDGFWCHPKVLGLSLEACGLWVRALSWSCAQRLDVVPVSFVRMVGASEATATELVDAGLWITDPDGWRIHNWTEYQTLTVSERRAEAGRKGGLASAEKRSKPEANRKQTASKNSLLTKQSDIAGTHPDPTRPVKPSSEPSANETVTAAIEEAVRQRQATTTGIRNPNAWRRTVRDQIVNDEDGHGKAARLLEQYPTANVSQIAAALNGSTVALRLLKRESLPNEPATP